MYENGQIIFDKICINCQLSYMLQMLNQINYQMSKNFRANLRTWLSKVYNLSKKPKRTATSIAKKFTNLDLKEPKDMIQQRILGNLYQRFEDMKDRDLGSAEGMEIIDTFLRQNELTINDKLQEMITLHVERFFSKCDENPLDFQDYVANVWNELTATYECVCPKTTKDLRFSQQKYDCYRCQRTCHLNCFWGREKDELYECPMCFLKNCIPNKQVKKILFAGFLRQIKKDKIQYKINLPLEYALTDDCIIEARCVRLCKDNKYEITWPMHCSVYLNSKKIVDFKPLNNNSSIKKRVDDQIIFEKKLLTKQNTIIVEEKHQYMEGFRPTVYENHLIVLFEVQPLTVESMVERMMESRMPVEESKQILREYLDRGMHDCFIDQLKIKLKCQYYNGKITIPARSKHCISHYQPFDLRGFIMANINIRSSSQRWKCPICRERAYHLVVDQYLLDFITARKDLTEIEFNNKGDYKMVEQQEESDNESDKVIDGQNQQPYFDVIDSEIDEDFNCNHNSLVQSNQKQGDIPQNPYTEFIQIQSEENQQQQFTLRPKRGINDRCEVDEIESSFPQKKIKQTNVDIKGNPFTFLRLKKASNLRESSDMSSQNDLLEIESKYSPQNSPSDFKPQKKQKRERKNRKDRVFQEEARQDLDKKSKILVPTPAISTVIPEAIRILQKKLPEISKRPQPQISIIDIEQSSDNELNQQVRRDLRLKHHLKELEKERNLLTQRTQRCDITGEDQSLFLLLCEKFMNASIKSY